LDFERGERIGPQFRCRIRGNALFVLPRHLISATSASF
jgi:hypothetical protein